MARVVKPRKPKAPPAIAAGDHDARSPASARGRRTTPSTRSTIARSCIRYFLQWCQERGITDPIEVTRPVLERYQRYLFHYRKKNGEPLSFRSPALAPGAVARVVPVDDAAESHPAQSGRRSWSCRALGQRAAQEHLLGPGGRADHAAPRHRTIPSACATAPSWKCSTRPACAAWRWSH